MSKVIEVKGKTYTLEFTFEAASCKDLVKKMFMVLSGAPLAKYADSNNEIMGMIEGLVDMTSEIPEICKIAFYAGMLENNPITEGAAKNVLKNYMIENDLGFDGVFQNVKEWMEEDGFFKISGLSTMLDSLNTIAEDEEAKTKKTNKKTNSKVTSI